jgi:hypothetical protein
MEITIELGRYLLEEAKQVAAESGRTLDEVISDALCVELNRRRAWKQSPPPKENIPTFGGGGVLPGVDLSNNAALFDLIESERDAVIRERCSSKQNGAAKATSSS